MSTFNIDDKDFYMIGAHGCSPTLHITENIDDSFSLNRYFIVPENFIIVYLNSNGVLSQGDKNIPFIKNLHDYNFELFKYILNPSNYEINMDKSNPKSYRHKNFFQSLPFFSNFNYLCNFELYPAGSQCPFINLNFSNGCESRDKCYFEGIAQLKDMEFSEYGEKLNVHNVINPSNFIKSDNGFVYSSDLIKEFIKKFNVTNGIIFISACRAEYYNVKEKNIIIDNNPIDRNCADINYDLELIDNLILKYKMSNELTKSIEKQLNDIKEKIQIRDRYKNMINNEIYQKYIQNSSFFNYDPIENLYNYIYQQTGLINIFVNFKKIEINCDLIKNNKEKIRLLELINHKFDKFRSRLIKRHIGINECNNAELYFKYGHLFKFIFYYAYKNTRLPEIRDFYNIWHFISTNYNSDRDLMTESMNEHIKPIYNFEIPGRNNVYKKKYLKYKNKYLKFKEITNY